MNNNNNNNTTNNNNNNNNNNTHPLVLDEGVVAGRSWRPRECPVAKGRVRLGGVVRAGLIDDTSINMHTSNALLRSIVHRDACNSTTMRCDWAERTQNSSCSR